MLPYVTAGPVKASQKMGAFMGLNKNLVIGENEFSDMENMSSRQFPAISVRERRGKEIKALTKPNGLFYKNGLVYVDGTGLFYKDKKIADVTDSKKTIVGLGAYIVVFPDKILYNTADGKKENLEAAWTQGAQATYEQTTQGSTMVKISCAGINALFSQFDGVEISGCSEASLNGSKVIQEIGDGYIVIIGDMASRKTQDAGLAIKRTVPDMDFVCESENRLWGCSSANHEIYASKLGDPKNWQAYEGIATDSYAVTVGSDGDFTGCISHLGYVLFFKEDTIHKVFGNKPSNYQVTTSTPVRGVAKGLEKTLCIANETLLYACRGNICSYDGAQPEAVGNNLDGLDFTEGVAGQYDGKYYASLKDGTGEWGLYVYDVARQLWHKEDGLHLVNMVYGGGMLYCLDDKGSLFPIAGDRDEYIPWMVESGDLLEGSVDYKYSGKIRFHLRLARDSEVNVLVKYDGDLAFKKVATYRARYFGTQTVTLIPHRYQKYRWRLEGYGDAALIAMSRDIGKGSDINGRI